MYEKMIAVTNRHLVLEEPEDKAVDTGAEWSEAYIRQLEYIASLHPKAMVLREKDLSEEKYEELAKVVIPLCQQAETTLILHRFTKAAEHLGYHKLHLPLDMLKNNGASCRTYSSRDFHSFCRGRKSGRVPGGRLFICRKYIRDRLQKGSAGKRSGIS